MAALFITKNRDVVLQSGNPIIIFLLIDLKFQFDRDLKEKKNPPEFKNGLGRQQRDLERIDLMKMKNVLASSTDQGGNIEQQEISEGNFNKVKSLYS